MALSELPFDNGKRICKVFEQLGFKLEGRSEKNHFILRKPNDLYLFISIPDHREVDRKTLKAEVRKIGISDAKFREHYDAMYAKRNVSSQVIEMELICPLCRMAIEPSQPRVRQESGLDAHKKCHERQFGPTGTTE